MRFMKMKTLLLGLLIAVIMSSLAHAKHDLGVGIIVGEPTGVSVKTWINDRNALDAAVAWSFSENDSFQFHADYLFHNFSLIKMDDVSGTFPVYFGLGGRIKLKEDNKGKGRNDDDALVGIRVPFGISYLFADAPVELFVELVPILDIAPDSDFDLNGAIGARFYFN
jgi:hypothetical protein